MLYEDAQLRIAHVAPPDTVLLSGDIDVTNSTAVAGVLDDIVDQCGQVIVDTGELRFVDISGWRVLVAPGIEPSDRRPRLINVAPCVQRLTKRILDL